MALELIFELILIFIRFKEIFEYQQHFKMKSETHYIEQKNQEASNNQNRQRMIQCFISFLDRFDKKYAEMAPSYYALFAAVLTGIFLFSYIK